MRNPPKIIIYGTAGSGKSSLAYAIKGLLKTLSIESSIEGDEDESPEIMEKDWVKRADSLKGKLVVIETRQGRMPLK